MFMDLQTILVQCTTAFVLMKMMLATRCKRTMMMMVMMMTVMMMR